MITSTKNLASSDRVHKGTGTCPGNYTCLWTKSQQWVRRLSEGLAIGICLSLVVALEAQAATYSFTKIADTKSTFQSISRNVAINDSGIVAFTATPLVGLQRTLYTSNGNQLTEIANSDTVPYLSERSSASGFPYLINSVEGINNNGTIAFTASMSARYPETVLLTSQGSSFTTRGIGSIGLGTSISLTQASLNERDELVYLRGINTTEVGSRVILTRPNQPDVTIATAVSSVRGSSPPADVPFSSIDSVDINNNSEVVFAATSRDGTAAIYTIRGDSLSTLVETGANALDINDSGDVALSNQNAISLFNRASGILNAIADTSGQFRRFSSPAINNNGKLAFAAILPLGESGIYTGADPVNDKVIASGDTLFGSTVTNVSFLRQGLNNKGQIVFFAEFTDGTQGVFLAERVSDSSEPQPQIPQPEEAFTLSKIVDTFTPIPDDVGNFTSVGSSAIDGNTLVFNTTTTSEQQGIYKISDGVPSKIADKNTAVPGSNFTFSSFSAPVIDRGNVVFGAIGSNSSSFIRGIYIQRGEMEVVVDSNTPLPGGGRNFSDFPNYALDGGNVAFRGFAFDQDGIYLSRDGAVQVIASRNTPIPGGTGNFLNFGGVALDGDNVVFSTQGQGQQGVYQSRDGSLQVVADTNTTIPGGVGNFTRFSNPGIDGNNVVFGGFGTNSQQGIYISRAGVLQLVVNNNTKITDSRRTFDSFSDPVIDGDIVAFLGSVNVPNSNFTSTTSGPIGIYVYKGDTLLKVVDLNSRLDGKRISSLSLGRDAINAGSLTFTAIFTDGSRGIYRADLITAR